MNLSELLKPALLEKVGMTSVLCVFVYLVWGKMEDIETKNSACQEETRRMLLDNQRVLIEQLTRSNDIIQANTDVIREIGSWKEKNYAGWH